ncbi:hypothetical protein EDC94DRAFT_525233, partial [Helicostylum pulchrum]
DTGYGIGSRLKVFNRCGGIWMPKQHSRYLAACITNEDNTCIFCFKKPDHPFKRIKDKQGLEKVKSVNGSFICYNQSCPSVYLNQPTHWRDSLSAAAIAFSGACSVILGMPCPHFNPKISQINTDEFYHIAIFSIKKTRSGLPSMTRNTFLIIFSSQSH